ncbi:MAG: putative thioredoxin [Thiomicrorhabdus sp.]|nr:MAG: putative thioredoxin [Thiomicrorhabdus sp.]
MQAMIIDVTINNFQEMVMQNSKQHPVLINFWSPTNEQSKLANTILEKLAHEMAGKFILVKINYDQQHELVQKLAVPKPPFYKVIKDGNITTESEGLLSEDAYRSLLNNLITEDPSENLRKQAAQAFAQGQFDQAVALLGNAARENPNNFKVHLDLVQLYLHSDQLEQAKDLFTKLPESAQKDPQGLYIKGILYFSEVAQKAPDVEQIQTTLSQDSNNCDALFNLTAILVLNGQMENALQTLFKLFNLDRSYQEGLPQKTIIKVFDMLSGSQADLVTSYRRKFQSLLY